MAQYTDAFTEGTGTPVMATRSASEVVGLNIRAQRQALGLTQEDANRRLAKYLGREPWSAALWRSIEKPQGRRKMRRLDADDLAAIAAVLETTVAALFDDHAPAPATQRCALCPSLHRWLRQAGLTPAGPGEGGGAGPLVPDPVGRMGP